MRGFPGTIIVMFQRDAGVNEVGEFFDRFRRVEGVQVSELTNMYAVDVPAEEEQYYIEVFQREPLVRYVNKYFLPGKKWVRRVVMEEEKVEKVPEKLLKKVIKKEKVKPKKSK